MTLNLKNNHSFFLLLLVVIGFFLRFNGLDKFGLAGDEKYSLFVSQFTSYQGNNQKDSVRNPDSKYFTTKEFWSKKKLSDFYDAIARVDTGNGAFFTYILHWWTLLFGVSDSSLRMLPLLFSLGIIPLIYTFVKTHFEDKGLALVAATLATFSPMLISYAQVARNYAVLFFFALLSTHFFLKYLREATKSRDWWLCLIVYGISAAICEMNHLSTITLFVIHFLYLFLYRGSKSTFIGFFIAMLIPTVTVLAWILCPGGKYIFEYVANSVRVYNEMAESSPYEYLSKTTFTNVTLQIRHVISAMFINIDGFYQEITGKKIGLAASAMFLAAVAVYNLNIKPLFKHIAAATLFILSLLLTQFQEPFLPIFILNLGISVITFRYAWRETKGSRRKPFLFISSLSILPILFLVLYALQDGNTFRVMVRYAGFAYSFCLIFVALLYKNSLKQNLTWKAWIYIAIIGQAIQIGFLIKSIYQDTQPRYFSNYAETRKANPYPVIAEKIVSMAAEGDTIVYPSDEILYDDREPIMSVIDAQMTNFYLPKELEIPQRVDPYEPDKVFLVKANNERIELFDFEGTKYRY